MEYVWRSRQQAPRRMPPAQRAAASQPGWRRDRLHADVLLYRWSTWSLRPPLPDAICASLAPFARHLSAVHHRQRATPAWQRPG